MNSIPSSWEKDHRWIRYFAMCFLKILRTRHVLQIARRAPGRRHFSLEKKLLLDGRLRHRFYICVR